MEKRHGWDNLALSKALKMFDEDVKTLQSTLSPCSSFLGQKVVEDEDKVTEKEQAFY